MFVQQRRVQVKKWIERFPCKLHQKLRSSNNGNSIANHAAITDNGSIDNFALTLLMQCPRFSYPISATAQVSTAIKNPKLLSRTLRRTPNNERLNIFIATCILHRFCAVIVAPHMHHLRFSSRLIGARVKEIVHFIALAFTRSRCRSENGAVCMNEPRRKLCNRPVA